MNNCSKISKLAIGLLLWVSTYASACSLGDRMVTLQLDESSSGIGAKNARALAEWFIKWRDGLGIESMIVVAPAMKAHRELALARLHNIELVLTLLNTGNAQITYEVEPREDGFSDEKYLNSVDLSVQPACIKTGTCCHDYRAEQSVEKESGQVEAGRP